jgi:uncharacterized protein (UPF0262 family)
VTASAEHRLTAVEIDEASLAPLSPDVENERQVAIADLLHENYFEPLGAPGGPYQLKLSLMDGRLALDISGPGFDKRHLLSLTPFKGTIKDYFLVCDSYHRATRDASPGQLEALDMGRRGLHNEGSERLRERLSGKVNTDLETARRLFTLICALYRRS